jgi:hypothetical protein
MARMARQKKNKEHQLAIEARARVTTIIDQVSPEDLVNSIKRAPSLRGMILGYIAEEMFQRHILEPLTEIEGITKHDDHDRTKNKSDRSFTYKGKTYSVQLKSLQTNSITYDLEKERLEATVQNDASDSRKITLPSGKEIITTCYVRGEYDILAASLFPFTGTWAFAYKWNVECRSSSFKGYDEEDRRQLLASTEKIYWPLDNTWATDLIGMLEAGEPEFDVHVEVEEPDIVEPIKDEE